LKKEIEPVFISNKKIKTERLKEFIKENENEFLLSEKAAFCYCLNCLDEGFLSKLKEVFRSQNDLTSREVY